MGAVRLESVWKEYPQWDVGPRTLRGIATRRVPLLARRGEQRWVLRDVSVEVGPGGSVGVIGRNGAGKSTLLRLAAGLGRPTRGRAEAPAGIAAVLNPGDTFDPGLSGRENALTAAVVAGWSRRRARELVPEMISFGELEEVADAPVRTYSDGMRLRLAFGVVAKLEPTALILDEVIAVGDLAFQAKCIERIRELRMAGTGLLLASHDLALIASECDHALWLEGGEVRAAGEAAAVVDRYEHAARERSIAATPAVGSTGSRLRLRHDRVGPQEARIEGVRLNGQADSARIATGDPLTVAVPIESEIGALSDPIVAVAIHAAGEKAASFSATTRDSGVRLGPIESGLVSLRLERLDLRPGRYEIDVGLYRNDWDVVYDFHWHAYTLDVEGGATSRGPVAPPMRWELSEP